MLITLEEALPEASNQSWLDGFEKELRLGWELEKAQYKARQMAARKDVGERIRNIDGLGQLTGVIDARTYFRWQQEDEHFWEDDGNYKRFLRDNPECRAPDPVKKTVVVR